MKNVIKSDEKLTLNIQIYENTPSYPPFFLYAHSKNFIIHKYWHTQTLNKNETKRNEIKRNQRKQNEINENKTK
jgi:hypothetical protein